MCMSRCRAPRLRSPASRSQAPGLRWLLGRMLSPHLALGLVPLRAEALQTSQVSKPAGTAQARGSMSLGQASTLALNKLALLHGCKIKL